jgi:oxalate decarboxylase
MPGPIESASSRQSARRDSPSCDPRSGWDEVAPTRKTKRGEVRVADSRNFEESKTIAVALLTVHPGGMR